jgi:hypothetical protein
MKILVFEQLSQNKRELSTEILLYNNKFINIINCHRARKTESAEMRMKSCTNEGPM